MDLVEATYRATEALPPSERYGLVSQMRRAAVSVASNIAEGHARSLGDYVRHILISAGSLTELETQVELSVRLGFMCTPIPYSALKATMGSTAIARRAGR